MFLSFRGISVEVLGCSVLTLLAVKVERAWLLEDRWPP